jgi:hypothetical protein
MRGALGHDAVPLPAATHVCERKIFTPKNLNYKTCCTLADDSQQGCKEYVSSKSGQSGVLRVDLHLGLTLAKGGDPMSHGSAKGSVKSIRSVRG